MKHYLNLTVIICIVILSISIFRSCKKITVPEVTTSSVTDITATTALAGGNVTNNGGAQVTARGICWGTSTNPTIDSNPNKTSDGKGNGQFTSSIYNLTTNTQYHVRAYATNSEGTGYGNEVSFETPPPIMVPSISTNPISSVTPTTAVSGGSITSDGGGEITARGICWNTSGNPSIADLKTTNGAGTGSFTSNLTGLTDGTIYYIRAYAINGAGISYGEEISFITPVVDIEGNVYKTVKIGTQIWMAENLKTTMLNDRTIIPNLYDIAEWADAVSLACCFYENQSFYKEIYGAIYNWYTVNTGNLCPVGWHVPYIEEWNTLNDYIHADDSYGSDKLRESGYNHWDCTKEGTNETGFTALPGGLRNSISETNNGYYLIRREIWFWSASIPQGSPQSFFIYCAGTQSAHNDSYKDGRYIRCIKN